MKRTYIKPDIVFEDFALSTNVSAGCEKPITNQAYNDCGMPSGREFLFTAEMQGVCTKPVTELPDTGYNGLCYHVPIETNNLFNS